MQTKLLRHALVAGFAILYSACCLPASAQGTAFTYQGRLNNNGAPANGSYDLAFTLFANRTGGTALFAPVTNTAVSVTNGLFTTLVDFGGVFNGTSNWLQLAVSTNAANTFSPLIPRQQITPTPYALYSAGATTAGSASTAASVPASGIGPGTANISISGNAATATAAATAGLAATATTATSATSATTASTASTATSAIFAGTATNLIGLLPDAQLSANIARLNGTNLFTGTNTLSNTLIATNPANQIFGTFTGSGAGLANLSSVSLAPASITAAMLAPDAVTMLGTPGNGPTNAVNVSTNGGVGVGIGTNPPTAGLQIGNVVTQTVFTAQFAVQDGQNGWTNLNDPTASAIKGNLLALGASPGLTLADITVPSSPVILVQLVSGVGVFTNILQIDGLAWAGSNLVAASVGSSAVTIIGCTNPVNPVKLSELRNGVGGWNYLGGASSVAVSGKLLAIGANLSSAVTLADISNPGAPVLRGLMVNGLNTFTNLNAVSSVALATNTALGANLLAIGCPVSNAVTLVNVADPTNPQKLTELRNGVGGFTNLIDVTSVALSGNLLAIAADGSSAVTLVDLSNPSNPVKLAELRDGVNGYSLGSASTVVLASNRLVIASSDSSMVTLVDVSNPSAPILLATATDGLNGVHYIATPTTICAAGTNVVVTGVSGDGFTILSTGTQGVGAESAGWVGIGTTHPAAALDVVGSVLVENATLFDVSALAVVFGTSAMATGDNSVAMGDGSIASGSYSVAMGEVSVASGLASIAMGEGSLASGTFSTAMGAGSIASGSVSFATGDDTTASGGASTAMGIGTTASAIAATALGDTTTASGQSSTAMGYSTTASGLYSMALGCYAQATNTGSLVWSDNNFPGITSLASNSVTMRASGGYRLFSNAGSTLGVTLAPGATAWSTLSDQNAKKNFTAVSGEEVLAKLAGVPVEKWNYKWEKDSEVPHIGPMAQAFKAAFYPGRDDKSITTLEFDGVELAAIQGLNQKLEARSEKLETENAELKAQLNELKTLVKQLVDSRVK